MLKFPQKLVLIISILLLAVAGNCLYAQENPGADDDDKKCKGGQQKPESLIWGYSIGETSYKKPDLLKTARAGATKGYRLGKNPPTFDESLSTSYLQNLTSNRNSLNLSLETLELNQAVLSAASLKVNRESTSQVIEKDGAIRQVLTSTTITEILPQPVGFHVKVYDRNAKGALGTNGLYAITSTAIPIKEMIMRTPGGGAFIDTVESVIIDRENSGGVRVEVFRHTRNKTADTQKMSTYAGSLNSAGIVGIGELLETEEIAFSNRGSSPQTYTLVREIKRITTTPSGIQSGDLKLVSRRLEQYVDSATGDFIKVDDAKPEVSVPISTKRLVREVDGYGTSGAKETRYSFYVDKDNKMINGRLKSKVYPDGSWEFYSYVDKEGAAVHQQTKISTWRDSAFNESTGVVTGDSKTETISVDPSGYSKTISYGNIIASKEIFSSITEADGSRVNTMTIKDGTDAVMSVRIWKLNPENAAEHLAGRIAWMENPDGTAETYEYIPSIDGGFQIVHRKGAGTRNGVTTGTETTTEYNKFVLAYAETVHDIAAGLNLNFWVATSVDVLGRPARIEYNGNSDDYEMFQYACCGLERKRDRNGSVTTWMRDPLKRVYLQRSYRYDGDSSPLITSHSFDGLVTSSSEGGILVNEETQFLNGERVLIKTSDQDGDGNPEVTAQSTSYASGSGRIVSIIYPDGGTETQSFFKDGQLKSVTGSAVADVSYSYGAHPLGLWKQVVRLNSSGGTGEWEKSYYDGINRLIKIEGPSASNSYTRYWQYYSASTPTAVGSRTKLSKFIDEDGVQTYYTYDLEGELASYGKEIPNSKILYELYSHQTVSESGLGIGKKITTTLRSGPTGVGVVTSAKFTSGDGFSSRSTSLGQTTTTVRTPASATGNYSVTTVHPDNTQLIKTYQGNLLTKVETQDSSAANVKWSSYTYDSLRRLGSTTDSRMGTTTINSYTNGGNVVSQTDSGGRLTAYSYDSIGRRISLDAPDTSDGAGNPISNITSTSWYPTGQEKATWGDQVYASYKSYDEQGRLSSLSTYRNLSHGVEPTSVTAGADTTLWNYNTKGLLASKRYADNTGSSYLYTSAGRLSMSTTARGITITHTYDKGYLVLKNYSDLTPDVTLSYDDYAQISSLSQFKQSLISYAYDPVSLALKTETTAYDINHDGTADFTRILDRSKDSIRRDKGWQLKNGTTVENEVGYDYDASGRLAYITKDASSFNYQYVTNSNLIAQISKPDGRKAINTWEATRDNLLNIRNVQATAQHTKYSYTLDELGRRYFGTEQATVHSSTVISRSWNYNARGELVFSGSSQTGSIRSYEYDSIGNRTKSADGWTLPTADNYSSNSSNQYEELLGKAPVYDGDGNANEYPLPSTGSMATLEWDAENQLTLVTDNSNSIEYIYDAFGRRTAKLANGNVTLYIYDKWHCIADYSYAGSVASLTRTYLWGLDLSGTIHEAAGVGGLLRITLNDITPIDYYPSYDGNGNICEYRSTSTVTHFDYDSFGRVISSSGTPELFDILYSTKREDRETGLIYYGFRYYDPIIGRWLSKDPVGEQGGINLYAFVSNSPSNYIDLWGLMSDAGQATVDANVEANRRTKADGKEHCTVVCTKCVDGKTEVKTEPFNQGTRTSCLLPSCSEGYTKHADIHSHPGVDPSPSEKDLLRAALAEEAGDKSIFTIATGVPSSSDQNITQIATYNRTGRTATRFYNSSTRTFVPKPW